MTIFYIFIYIRGKKEKKTACKTQNLQREIVGKEALVSS